MINFEHIHPTMEETILRLLPDNTLMDSNMVINPEVYSFPQTWGSTALGFGGIGGQAITTAQTTVIFIERCAFVFFNKRFAYKIESPNQSFYEDMRYYDMSNVYGRSKYLKNDRTV